MVEEEPFARVRLPRKGEILGVVIGMMGGSRMLVDCLDGKERMCRVPGKIKRFIWVKDGDAVLIKPWAIEADKKGDIAWRYTRLQADWLRREGYLK
ncbi:MAG: translation initiation factor eIF-1A [Candidatus Fermentimicrarchaeum limneticum]|jgi:translation initiation factor 1A|uniref:Translation initiation factor 1A n=1 Tax=Fermentimicrarchaeum limneticum TaxID=2795018 RepID=A0A7D6BC94_FERL1|nr:MAG: translation initiation factor eIF-1A [Candidatus Fermentimicrarchaeum limneticum]